MNSENAFSHLEHVQQELELEAKTAGVIARIAEASLKDSSLESGEDALDRYVAWFNNVTETGDLLVSGEYISVHGGGEVWKEGKKESTGKVGQYKTAMEANHQPTMITVFQITPEDMSIEDKLRSSVKEHFLLMQELRASETPITREWLQSTFEEAITKRLNAPKY